jgi:2-keto-4-pentenoate hydratase/2-oxohepta-3-ene-1,7-dioic acid hydratase in catechol pathway
MKIVRYADPKSGSKGYGVLDGETVHAATGDPFAGGLTKGAAVGSVGQVTLDVPVQPGKIVCVGLNYAAHVTETDPNRPMPEEPVLFMKPQSSLIPQGGTIKIVNLEHNTDYEAELVIVIGKTAFRVSESDAGSYILGYSAGNDVSDRVLQRKDGQWIRAKGFDTYCPLGPCIETEIDPGDLKIESRLNGQVKQSSRTSDMVFKPHFLVSYISEVMTLNPGDVIMTGTPEGVGPMKPGDTIEVEISGVGVLRNPVAAR